MSQLREHQNITRQKSAHRAQNGCVVTGKPQFLVTFLLVVCNSSIRSMGIYSMVGWGSRCAPDIISRSY